jgi:hypothetical protein
MRTSRIEMLALVLAAGCASTPEMPATRFANAPAVQRVDDRRNVPAPPEQRPFHLNFYTYNGAIQRPLIRAPSARSGSTRSTRCRTRPGSPTGSVCAT